MALDDDGMKNQYLTKLRVKIREDSGIMRELTEMLHDFVYSYNAELQSVGIQPPGAGIPGSLGGPPPGL